MNDTVFTNSSGWHDGKQITTAIDLAKLSLALKAHYPKFYPLFAKNSFEFRGKTVLGHNRVLKNYAGAEGLKTGFTTPAGFNLITTASRGNKSLLGVVTGCSCAAVRDKKMIALLDKHFKVATSVSYNKAQDVKVATNYKTY
jgi:D-alanyl-D-alanine carboxypeptidase (penicillin-binding protein 5/6)